MCMYQENPVQFLGWEDLLEKGQAPTPVFLGFPGGSAGKEFACSIGDPGVIPGLEDPLEKQMATHSSILAQRILWTEQHGRLHFMGLQSRTRWSK